jgi:hypothetical protein
MATRFLHGNKFIEQLWKPFPQGTILASVVEIELVVFEKKIHKFNTGFQSIDLPKMGS